MKIQKGSPAAAPEHPADAGILGRIFAAAMSGGGQRICAHCGALLGINKDLPADQISHGMCNPPCPPAVADGWAEFSADPPAQAGLAPLFERSEVVK